MSQAGRYTPEVTPGTYIEMINGDVGSVSGAVVSFIARVNSGSSVEFVGTGSTMFLDVTDANINTLIGNNTGNDSLTGTYNTGLGGTVLTSLTTGSYNEMIGAGSGSLITTGSYNIGIGYDAGFSYTSSESSNILLNNTGTISESNTLRIGAGTGTGNGDLNRAFISGIEGITVSTADQVLVINSSNQIGAIAHGSSGQILTSAGVGANPTWSNNAAITTIDGDVGSVSGNTVSFNGIVAGSSVNFNGSVTTMLLEVTDSNINTIIGNNAGNSSISGAHNTGLGASNLLALTSGSKNCALGVGALEAVTSGASNIGIGYDAGSTLTTGSNNIYIGQITGASATEADTTRIGNSGSTAACYILGIGGVDVASTANVVVENDDQLGTAVLAAGAGVNITAGPNIITVSVTGSGFTWHDVTSGSATMAAQNGYIIDRGTLTTLTLPTNNSLGDTIQIVGKGSGGWIITYGTGQYIVYGDATTTTTTGDLSSNNASDCINLVCTTASATAPIFTVTSSIGNINVV